MECQTSPMSIPPEIIVKDANGWVFLIEKDALECDRPLIPVKIGGDKYILFKDGDGRIGLIARNCPHRGADLCFGRLEKGGIRCPFHGWYFDRNGQCLEQPAEPPDSKMFNAIKLPNLQIKLEKKGVFAYIDV